MEVSYKNYTHKLLKYVATIDDILVMDQSQIDINFIRKTRLTPRSVEAFRRSGILPSDIVYPS
jgi:hypothetical protein